MYIYAGGAENTKVSTKIKCKVWNFDNIQPDSANKEQQQKKLLKFQEKTNSTKITILATATREIHEILNFACLTRYRIDGFLNNNTQQIAWQ